MSNELDDFLRRKQLEGQGTARTLVEASATVSPDEAARRARYRREYGVDAPQVAPQPIETNEHLQEALAAVNRDPTVAKWMARHKDNAALARGGAGQLADVSEAVGTAGQPRERSWLESARQALMTTTAPGLGLLVAQQAGKMWQGREDLTPGNIGRSLGAGTASAASGFAGVVEAGAELYGRYSPSAAAGRALFGTDGTESIAGFARQRRQGWEQLAQETRPDAKTEEGRAVLSGLESIPLTGLALAGAFTGGSTTAAALMGSSVGGQSYGRARDYGLSIEQSALYGAIDAGIETVTERLTFMKALDVGSPFMKRFGQTLLTENIGEQFATLGQDFNEWANISSNEGKTFGDFLAERPEAAYQTAIAATITTGAIHTTTSAVEFGLNKVGRTLARAAYTDDTRRFAESLSGLAKANVVLQRDRGSFEEFVREAAEGTEATDVFVEAEQLQTVLNQSQLTVDEAFDMTGLTPEQLQEAVDRGEDVAIPVEQYAARIAPTAIGDGLLDHLRLDPDHMSPAQAKVYLQGVKEELAAAAEQGAVQSEQQSERQASRSAVEGRVLSDLQTARRFTDDVNETYASLVGAFYDTQSAKLGITAEEMFTRYPLRVQSGEVAQPTFDQQQGALVNIGLDIPAGGQLDPQQVRDALAKIGVNISGENIAQSDTEQTFIGQLDRALTTEEAYALSEALGQEAVAQFAGGQGALIGPQAEKWGDFNPEFFLGMDGGRLQTPLTETPEFKAWFGDSKVVDADGKPLVVYHGGSDWEALPQAQATWFTDSEVVADGYADQGFSSPEIKAVYLKIENPLDLRDPNVWPEIERHPGDSMSRVHGALSIAPHLDAIKAAGFDGIIHYDTNVKGASRHTSYVTIGEGAQAKSAGFNLGEQDSLYSGARLAPPNRGTFDPNDPRILFQSAAPLQTLPLGVQGTGPGGRVRNWDVGEAFTLRHRAKYGRALDPTNPEDYQIALDAMLEDYANQQAQPDNGEAWYIDDIAEAIRVTEAILPEISDPVRRDIFLTAVALLSPQQGPIDNWGNAIVAFTGYSSTGRFALRHPEGMEFGVKSHSTGLALFEHLINQHGEIGALVWLASEHTGAEMEAVRRASGLFKNKADNYLPKEMNKTESKLGAYIFGPKVGDFMLNSAGLDQNAVTVDLWMARTYNRLIGRLTDVNPKLAEEGKLADALRGKSERAMVKQLVRDAAAQAGIAPSAMQAALWYFEQRLYRNHGIQSESTSFSDAAREAALRRGIDLDGAAAQGSAQRSAEDARRDLDEGVRVYDQSGLNPLDAFKRESLYPTIAVRHADGTVYTDAKGLWPERLDKIAAAIGAESVVAVPAGDKRLQQGVPLWHTRPPLNADGTITIQHWGPEGVSQTDPSLWGQSNSLPRSERAAIGSSLPRTYFGIASGQPGGYVIEFPGRNQYEARVPAERLYDVAADPDGLKQGDGVNALERRIAAAGYLGYWSNNEQLGLVATVFEPVAVQPAKAQVFAQDAVFFSALERTLENTATNKASAQQWKATLEKTPGIKAEELEWTGLLEFLEMQEGPITREQLLEVVRGAGLRVDEVVHGGGPEAYKDHYEAGWSIEGNATNGFRVIDALGDVRVADDGTERFETLADAHDFADEASPTQYRAPQTQFASWSSDPSNETYRELLITLPIGEGRNPNRAPSTHWDTDGVIAHARFMDKIDADGKRVLFIEEVQSDWHQKGRDQGYAQVASPEAIAEAEAAYQAANRVFEANKRRLSDAINSVQPGAEMSATMPTRALMLEAEALISAPQPERTQEQQVELDAARRGIAQPELQMIEARAALRQLTAPDGIPNAPFRTDWPALVVKRMIRYAAEHGYERIAWTTGEQQAERYNLSQAVGGMEIWVDNTPVGKTLAKSRGSTLYNVRLDNERAVLTITENYSVLTTDRDTLSLTAEQVTDIFGKDLGGRMIENANGPQGLRGPVRMVEQDLRVGGEGMKAFYDRNLVNITNKLVKKYGAKVGVVEVVDEVTTRARKQRVERDRDWEDHRGLEAQRMDLQRVLTRTEDAIAGGVDPETLTPMVRPEGLRNRIAKLEASIAEIEAGWVEELAAVSVSQPQPGFDITPELADVAMGGFPLFQKTGSPRGQIALPADLSATSTITLLRGADLSTFVHELGHFFFEVTNHMASQAGAPATIVADRDAMLRYLGVESATEWENRTPAQRREGHERMARSFEAFLFEGRAPSLELRALFGRLRNWMIAVYRTITRLDVELTDEVRGAFTRMLASDEAIAEAEADGELQALFQTQPEGMSDSDWEEYQQLDQDARTEAAIQLESRSLRDMRFAGKAVAKEIKRLQREVADQRAVVREEVEAELSQTPVYSAMAQLRAKDGIKLNTGILKELLQLDGAPLPDAFRGMTSEDGIHPQQAAELFGFTSFSHMTQELLFASPLADAVEAETDQRMRERYGDLNTPEEVEQAARAAVHNEVRGRFVATELAALQKAPGKKRVLAAAAKRLAEDMIARLRIRDLRPGQYEAAERRAAKLAQQAGTDNIDELVRQKRNQLFQFNAAKAAHEARDEMRKAREYLTKFANKNTRGAIDVDFLDQIDQLLERYELRQISNREADRRKNLFDWIEQMRADGFEPAIDPETLAEIGRKNWRDLTVEEMRGVLDAIRNIEHLGRVTKKLLTAKDKADLDTAAGEMADAVRENATHSVNLPVGAKTWFENVKSGVADFFAMHRKIANMAYVFDGNQYGGRFWERFIRPMNERGDWQAVRNREANLQLAELFKPIAQENTTKREWEPAIGRSISLEDRLMVALNMGNEANLQRLMSGDKWEYDQVLAVVAPLQAHHWDFVESVWQHLDSYRPEIAAKERRVSGVEPQWVEAAPFQVEVAGELRLISGGYFPIKYDPDKNAKANADEASEVLKQMTRGLYTNSQTRRGHTKARVDEVNNRPLRKTFGVIFGHVNQVIHDLAWHEYLIDANRLLRHGAVDAAIREHYGPETVKWLSEALKDIAVGDIPAQNAFEKSIRHLRTGVSTAAMGWSIWTSLLQPTGLTQSMARIGPSWVLKGIGDWVGNPAKANAKLAWVREVSPFMRERGDTMQREISEIKNRIGAKSPLREGFAKLVPAGVSSAVGDSFFYMIAKAQLVADVPTWLGQYEKSMAADEQHDRAVAIADQAVIDSQGGGQTKDLAGIQRGSELMRLFTNFYSYFSATFNLMADRTTEMKRVGARDLPYYAIDMMLLSVVPATISSLMYNVLKGGDDDDDDLLKQVAQDNLVYMLGLMVGVREIGSALAGVAGYTGPAGARFFSETGRFGKQVAQGEIDEPLLRAGNSMAGILFHYPATQLDRTVRGSIQYAEGEAGPQAILVGPPAQ